MASARKLETVEGLGDVYVAKASFDKQIPAFQKKGISYFISVRDDSYLRLNGNNRDWTRTCHAPMCAKDSPVIIARISPAFEDTKMAKVMVEAHRNNQYAVFARDVYGQWEKIAKQEKKKKPENRTAHVLSERGDYQLHKDSDDAKFFWQDQRKQYFREKVSGDSIDVWQINPTVVDAQEETIVNYTWFVSVDDGSGLGFWGADLECDSHALGVLTPEASAVVESAKLIRKKISPQEMKVNYTQKEIDRQLKILTDIQKGNIKISELESKVETVSAFMRKLKQ